MKGRQIHRESHISICIEQTAAAYTGKSIMDLGHSSCTGRDVEWREHSGPVRCWESPFGVTFAVVLATVGSRNPG